MATPGALSGQACCLSFLKVHEQDIVAGLLPSVESSLRSFSLRMDMEGCTVFQQTAGQDPFSKRCSGSTYPMKEVPR